MGDLTGWIGGGAAGLVVTVVTMFVLLRKSGPEARALKIANEKTIADMSTAWAKQKNTDLLELEARYDALEKRLKESEDRSRERFRRIDLNQEVHGRWDRLVVDRAERAGITLPPVPPLYLDDISA